jgi:hypothetical protein
VTWCSDEILPKDEKVFAHVFEEAEVGRVYNGVATITPSDGERPFIIGPGDVVEFGANFRCAFTVHETMNKTIVYLDAKGGIDYDTTKLRVTNVSKRFAQTRLGIGRKTGRVTIGANVASRHNPTSAFL